MLFFDSFGQPVGGEMFFEKVSLTRHRRAEFITPLKHYAADGGRIAVTLSVVETDSDTWRSQSDTKQLLDEMKRTAHYSRLILGSWRRIAISLTTTRSKSTIGLLTTSATPRHNKAMLDRAMEFPCARLKLA
jgi:hypothetical protein